MEIQKEKNIIKEDAFGKSIANFMGKQPEVSDKISTRLAFSRETAIKHAQRENFIIQGNKLAIVRSKFQVPQMWLAFAALIFILMSFQALNTDYDDLDYHSNADQVDLDFLR